MTALTRIRETFDDGGCLPKRKMPLFASLSISEAPNKKESGGAGLPHEDSGGESASAEIRLALDSLLDLHARMEIEKELLDSLYKRETIRWLSGIVSGISPQLSQPLIYSTVEEIAERAFTGDLIGSITIRMNPSIAAPLIEACPKLKTSSQILIQEDPEQPASVVLALWDGGRLKFDAAEAMKKLDLLLTPTIEKAEVAERQNEFNYTNR